MLGDVYNMHMKYRFRKFEGKYFRGDEMIAINKSGLIRLSSGFCRTTNITRFTYIIMFYDPVNRAIALKFIKDAESGALKVTKDGTGATVAAKSFFLSNKLDLFKLARRYRWKNQIIPDIGEVYIIELSD